MIYVREAPPLFNSYLNLAELASSLAWEEDLFDELGDEGKGYTCSHKIGIFGNYATAEHS